MKKQHDAKLYEPVYDVGETVYLRDFQNATADEVGKFRGKYRGPFKVRSRWGDKPLYKIYNAETGQQYGAAWIHGSRLKPIGPMKHNLNKHCRAHPCK